MIQDFQDPFKRVPGASGDRHAQLLLDFAETADRFHFTMIHTEEKSSAASDDFQEPLVFGGQMKWDRE